MIDTVRLSQTARGQLIRLKTKTGVKNWNTLCRWGLVMSLRDPSTPLVREVVADSNVEMSWKTFAGSYGDLYMALLKQRCVQDGTDQADPAVVAHALTIHLHRGIGYLAGRTDLRTISDLIFIAMGEDKQLDFLIDDDPEVAA